MVRGAFVGLPCKVASNGPSVPFPHHNQTAHHSSVRLALQRLSRDFASGVGVPELAAGVSIADCLEVLTVPSRPNPGILREPTRKTRKLTDKGFRMNTTSLPPWITEGIRERRSRRALFKAAASDMMRTRGICKVRKIYQGLDPTVVRNDRGRKYLGAYSQLIP